MNNIYLPIDDFNSYSNYYYLDNYTIVAYNSNDDLCSEYILNNHYFRIDKDCQQYHFSQLQEINSNNLTNDFLYRLDITSLIILLVFMCFICVFLPYYVVSSLWRKRHF